MDPNYSNNPEQNIDNSKSFEPPGVNKPQIELKKRFLNKKLLIIGIIAVFLLIALALFFIFSTRSQQPLSNEVDRQNERLIQINPELENEDLEEINANRGKVYAYASENGISVSDEEINNRKANIIQSNGHEETYGDLAAKGWNDDDWTEVLRWQVLREKILANLEAYRIGEVLMIRWDSTVPEINETVASTRRPIAENYLESVRTDLTSGSIANLQEARLNLDTDTNPFTNSGFVYDIQYTGLNSVGSIESTDPEINGYYRFEISENVANAQVLSGLNIPSVSEVMCNLRSCHIYNIVGGSNGATTPAEEEILNALVAELLI